LAKEADQDRLFRAALSEGSEEAIGEWIASGPEAVRRLYVELSGEHRVEVPDGLHPRDFLDNLNRSCHLLGAAYSNEFMETFESAKWSTNPFVISGLGGTPKPEATRRLIRLMANEDEWVRINAVVALRGHRHRGMRSVLLTALQDSNDLVRYHAGERLSELEDGAAL